MIDWSAALDSTGGDEALLVDVIEAFQEEAPRLMENIRQAIAAGDTVLLHRASHTLKTNLLSLGAADSGQTAFTIEKLARNQQLEGTDRLCHTLETALPGIYDELNQYVRQRRGAR
ncbi:MAG: Hpt domain-containing protein [Pirellulaceae bacterium]|jgi:HPt (histidine-containing phosphotransfer) domain-containing protein|nr:Hpt domain-containing protein [Pirellulaceae bacterium]